MKRILMVIALTASTLGLVTVAPATAAAAEPNGCTAVPDSGDLFDFTEACNVHDLCYINQPYGDSSSARKQCDREFLDAMRSSCNDMWPRRSDFFERIGCKGVAGLYYVGVRIAGGLAWESNESPPLDA